MTDLVPAVGGTRLVPAPDPVARDYITLALRLDQHIPGLVDGYFGPADLKATVDMEQLRSPARLRDDATALRDRLAAEVADPDRRAWLDAQLVALETQAARPRRRDPAVPRLRHALLRVHATALPGRDLRGGGGTHRGAPARRRPTRGPPRSLGCTFRRAGRSAAGRGRLAGRPLPRPGRRRFRPSRRRGPAGVAGDRTAVVRLQLVRRRPPLPRRRQYRSPGPGLRPDRHWSPTRPTRATTSSMPGRKPIWSTRRAASSPRSCSSIRPSA